MSENERSLVEIQEVEIDGYTYKVTPAPATVSLRAAARVANVIGPMVAGLRASEDEAGAFARALSFFLRSPELGDHLDALCAMFAPHTQVFKDGKSFTLSKAFDQHFAGRLDALLKWLAFSLKVNLATFLAAVPSLANDAVGAAGSFGLTLPNSAKLTG